MFAGIPKEVVANIFWYIYPSCFLCVRLVCKKWNAVYNELLSAKVLAQNRERAELHHRRALYYSVIYPCLWSCVTWDTMELSRRVPLSLKSHKLLEWLHFPEAGQPKGGKQRTKQLRKKGALHCFRAIVDASYAGHYAMLERIEQLTASVCWPSDEHKKEKKGKGGTFSGKTTQKEQNSKDGGGLWPFSAAEFHLYSKLDLSERAKPSGFFARLYSSLTSGESYTDEFTIEEHLVTVCGLAGAAGNLITMLRLMHEHGRITPGNSFAGTDATSILMMVARYGDPMMFQKASCVLLEYVIPEDDEEDSPQHLGSPESILGYIGVAALHGNNELMKYLLEHYRELLRGLRSHFGVVFAMALHSPNMVSAEYLVSSPWSEAVFTKEPNFFVAGLADNNHRIIDYLAKNGVKPERELCLVKRYLSGASDNVLNSLLLAGYDFESRYSAVDTLQEYGFGVALFHRDKILIPFDSNALDTTIFDVKLSEPSDEQYPLYNVWGASKVFEHCDLGLENYEKEALLCSRKSNFVGRLLDAGFALEEDHLKRLAKDGDVSNLRRAISDFGFTKDSLEPLVGKAVRNGMSEVVSFLLKEVGIIPDCDALCEMGTYGDLGNLRYAVEVSGAVVDANTIVCALITIDDLEEILFLLKHKCTTLKDEDHVIIDKLMCSILRIFSQLQEDYPSGHRSTTIAQYMQLAMDNLGWLPTCDALVAAAGGGVVDSSESSWDDTNFGSCAKTLKRDTGITNNNNNDKKKKEEEEEEDKLGPIVHGVDYEAVQFLIDTEQCRVSQRALLLLTRTGDIDLLDKVVKIFKKQQADAHNQTTLKQKDSTGQVKEEGEDAREATLVPGTEDSMEQIVAEMICVAANYGHLDTCLHLMRAEGTLSRQTLGKIAAALSKAKMLEAIQYAVAQLPDVSARPSAKVAKEKEGPSQKEEHALPDRKGDHEVDDSPDSAIEPKERDPNDPKQELFDSSVLRSAVIGNHLPTVEYILSIGVEFDTSVVIPAVQKQNYSILKAAIAKGVHLPSEALTKAVENGDAQSARLLFEGGCIPEFATASALAASGDVELLKRCQEAGGPCWMLPLTPSEEVRLKTRSQRVRMANRPVPICKSAVGEAAKWLEAEDTVCPCTYTALKLGEKVARSRAGMRGTKCLKRKINNKFAKWAAQEGHHVFVRSCLKNTFSTHFFKAGRRIALLAGAVCGGHDALAIEVCQALHSEGRHEVAEQIDYLYDKSAHMGVSAKHVNQIAQLLISTGDRDKGKQYSPKERISIPRNESSSAVPDMNSAGSRCRYPNKKTKVSSRRKEEEPPSTRKKTTQGTNTLVLRCCNILGDILCMVFFVLIWIVRTIFRRL